MVRAAEEQGHVILWTPSGFSGLQPIKLVWARLKGNVGRQCDQNTKLKDVHERPLKQVDLLGEEEGIPYVLKVMEHCYDKSEAMWNEIKQDEMAEDAESEDDDKTNSQNNDRDDSGSDTSFNSSLSSVGSSLGSIAAM